jgi:hypothetical protein
VRKGRRKRARDFLNRKHGIGVIGVIPLFAPVIRYVVFEAILNCLSPVGGTGRDGVDGMWVLGVLELKKVGGGARKRRKEFYLGLERDLSASA